MSSPFSVVAIIAAFNEADIIQHVVSDLIDQGLGVYFLDDGSTDDTVALVEPYVGRGVLFIERLPPEGQPDGSAGFAWARILRRKAQLAVELDADWFIHHDADEFRESPWRHVSLIDAIHRVDTLGFNAIDFTGLDFWPVHDRFIAGGDVREALPFYSEPAPYDRLQIRAWKKTADLDLVTSGGHEAQFKDRRVFPLRFILRHYPVRGQAHGERKVFRERRGRFLAEELARGWHVQYDECQPGGSFIRDAATLTRYDAEEVRIALTLRHRDIEALEESVAAHRRELDACRDEVMALTKHLSEREAEVESLLASVESERETLASVRAELVVRRQEVAARSSDLQARTNELAARTADTAGLREALQQRVGDIVQLQRGIEEGARRLDDVHQSLSWRLTSPARAVYDVLRKR